MQLEGEPQSHKMLLAIAGFDKHADPRFEFGCHCLLQVAMHAYHEPGQRRDKLFLADVG